MCISPYGTLTNNREKRKEGSDVEVLYITDSAWQFLNGSELQAATDCVALLYAESICPDTGYLG